MDKYVSGTGYRVPEGVGPLSDHYRTSIGPVSDQYRTTYSYELNKIKNNYISISMALPNE